MGRPEMVVEKGGLNSRGSSRKVRPEYQTGDGSQQHAPTFADQPVDIVYRVSSLLPIRLPGRLRWASPFFILSVLTAEARSRRHLLFSSGTSLRTNGQGRFSPAWLGWTRRKIELSERAGGRTPQRSTMITTKAKATPNAPRVLAVTVMPVTTAIALLPVV